MVKLTEDMVIARTKQSNLSLITKLNCWGAQISDVTILRRMPNVTVLSLSVNNINTLADFQYCRKLVDLFVRNNKIVDLNEVCYLQDLPQLKSFWLDQNPCVVDCRDEGYRLSVIRALPQLQKLDDVGVDPSEVEKSRRVGRVLIHPEQQEEYYSEPDDDASEQRYNDEREVQEVSRSWQQQENNVQRSQLVQPEPQYYPRETPEATLPPSRSREYAQNNINHEIEREAVPESSVRPAAEPTREIPEVLTKPSPNKTEQEVPPEGLVKSPSVTSVESSRELPDTRPVCAKSEEPLELYSAQANMRAAQHNMPRSRTADGELGCCGEYRRYSRTCLNSCQGTGSLRRPVDRKTNVLNAVLCLIKELDYHNLEVVEMAVKCRMDELEG